MEEYFRNKLSDVINVPAIYTVHYFKYGKNFVFPLESHNFWELVFIDSGFASITQGDKQFNLSQGYICFHKPNIPHTITTKDDFSNSVIVSFEAQGRLMSFFENGIFYLNAYQKNLLLAIVNEGKNSYIDRLDNPYQKKMTKSENSPFGGEQFIKNNLELLLISIIRENYSDRLTKTTDSKALSPHGENIVKDIIEILNNNLGENITLDYLSKKLHFSKTYIKSTFKKYTGNSIIKYYNNLKVDEAKKLLSTNNYTNTEISKILGFSSLHYFTRLFKALTDMSPTEYKNSIKANNIL